METDSYALELPEAGLVRRCDQCRFSTPALKGERYCRRYPPVQLIHKNHIQSFNLLVEDNFLCGEFQQRVGHDEPNPLAELFHVARAELERRQNLKPAQTRKLMSLWRKLFNRAD